MNDNLTAPQLVSLPYKSTAISIIFTLILGPIGLLYASFLGGIVFTILVILALLISKTYPVMVWIVWIICTYYGAWKIKKYNKSLMKLAFANFPLK